MIDLAKIIAEKRHVENEPILLREIVGDATKYQSKGAIDESE